MFTMQKEFDFSASRKYRKLLKYLQRQQEIQRAVELCNLDSNSEYFHVYKTAEIRREAKGDTFFNMRSSIFRILLVATITCSLIVHAQSQECKCGGLGKGTNPCSCSEVVVKATKLPKPTYYMSPQDIKDVETAKSSTIVISGGTSQSDCSNSQSDCSNSQSASNGMVYSNSNGQSSPYSSTGSNAYVESDTIIINSNTNAQSKSKACGCGKSNNDANTQSESTAVIYSDDSSSGTSASAVIYTDNSNELKASYNYNKQNIEIIETDDMPNSDVNIVPRFSPVGDLCYPLPVEQHNGKLIEKATKVTPAYPGKLVCCPPSVPYEICINTHTGETRSKAMTASSSDGGSSVSNTMVYASSNSGTPSKPAHRMFPAIPLKSNGMLAESAPRLYGGFNMNSGMFGESKAGSYGPFTESNSKVYNVPSLIYANLNSGNRQKQRSKMVMSSSSDCFDDVADETIIDSYPAVPADAVSLTLAYKNLRAPNVIYRQGKQFVPEDKLSFGHRTVPIDVKSESKLVDIAEEKLVTVNKPVVELKLAPPRTVVIGSYDEQEEAKLAELEAMERESITQEESVDQMAESLLTYKDLGYAPVGAMYAKSRSHNSKIINGEISDSAEEPCGPLGPPLPDYIPGTVVVQKAFNKENLRTAGIDTGIDMEIIRSGTYLK
ncbi:hypothetical protein ANTPLA_LOCUS10363 [Anthophora plagiata]